MGRDSKGAQPRWDLGELLNAGAGVARSIRKTKEATLCAKRTGSEPDTFYTATCKSDLCCETVFLLFLQVSYDMQAGCHYPDKSFEVALPGFCFGPASLTAKQLHTEGNRQPRAHSGFPHSLYFVLPSVTLALGLG